MVHSEFAQVNNGSSTKSRNYRFRKLVSQVAGGSNLPFRLEGTDEVCLLICIYESPSRTTNGVMKIHCFCFCFCRGSVIARIIGGNVKQHPQSFEEEVQMYVYEELVEGRKLTDIINTEHENVKYLKGHKIPENIVS